MTEANHAVRLRGLVVDYGGVLTSPLEETLRAWAAADGIDLDHFRALTREWLSDGADPNPVHELETGRLMVAEFERLLAARLLTLGDRVVSAVGLTARMQSAMRPVQAMAAVVRRVREHGCRTALLSNSWGLDYPRDDWAELFDAVVISGEVGMRKPDREIYEHTADQLGLSPAECVFVDDLIQNVRGAATAGMVGVHHRDLASTREELENLFGVPLRDDDGPGRSGGEAADPAVRREAGP